MGFGRKIENEKVIRMTGLAGRSDRLGRLARQLLVYSCQTKRVDL